MSVIFKAKLKAAKTAIGEKNYDYSYDLCHDLLELDEANYNVHILLGVSCQHMEKWEEGEKVYQRAMQMPKANILAWQGICALYEAANLTDKYKQALARLCDKHLAEGNKDKAWEAMAKLIKLHEDSGNKRDLVAGLRQVTKAGEYNILLSAAGTDPAPPKLAEVLVRMYDIERDLDQKTVDTEVNKRKTRLGAGPIAKVRRDVRKEVWSQSGLLDTLSQLILLHLEEGSEEERLEYQEHYFNTLIERLVVVDGAQGKASMLDEAQRAAWDLASNGRCRNAFEHLIEVADGDNDDGNLKGLIEGYLQLFAEDGRLSKSAQAWMGAEEQENELPVLLELAQQGREAASDSPFASAVLVHMAIKAKAYRTVIDAGVAARQIVQQFEDDLDIKLWRSQMAMDLDVADAYTRLGPENATEAERLYRKCLEAGPGDARAILGLGLSLCTLENYNESKQLLSAALQDDAGNHLALGGLGYVALKEGNVVDAVDYFKRAISIESNYAAHHISLGNAYWQLGGEWQSDKQYAYSCWIKAARIDPNAAETFSGLGKWYQEHGNGDIERAKKCFAKAFSLDHTNGEAGQALSEIYLSEGSDDLCETLLLQATEAQRDQKWAWQLLGFLRLRQEQAEQAIVAFRNALSIDRMDRLCWEGLCEGYIAIGRINTSVKVAKKVVELDPDCVSGYWLCARACMNANELDSSLAYFGMAVECMQRSKDSGKLEVVWAQALGIGKAECLVACAERFYEEGLFGRVIDASNDALESPGSTGHYVESLFTLAEHAARLCVLAATSAALASAAWTDLARIYYERSSQTHPTLLEAKSSHDSSGHTSPLLEASANCAQAAIQLDPTSAGAYVAQGVVATHSRQAALAQHSFIMASRLSPTSALPWANLGFLYIHYGDMELANKAFSKAQMIDPEFIPGWLGQAVIAETLGYDDSLDLFANCIVSVGVSKAIGDFGFAKQVWRSAVERNARAKKAAGAAEAHEQDKTASGATGYGGLGMSGHLSFSQQSRLVLAIYSARRYVARTGDTHGAGSHLLGLLLEQNGEFESAAEAYAAAYERLTSSGGSVSGAGGGLSGWVALAHLGRAQCSAGQYVEAVATYDKADAVLHRDGIEPGCIDDEQVLYFTLGHSLALFFAERLSESLDKFEEALTQSAAVPQLRPFIAVMLAQVLWALGTEEHRGLARQHLLEVMSENTEFLPGLSALFAIGLQQGDGDLIAATYPELLKARDAGDPAHDVAKLEAYLALLREDPKAGRRALSKALYRSSSDASLWLLMANFEAKAAEQDSGNAAAMAAEAALSLFKQAMKSGFSWSGVPSLALANSSSLNVVVSASMAKSRALARCNSSASNGISENKAEENNGIAAARTAAKRAV
ncbi:Superkiller protein 3, partial [Dipsacomyces acuminosporus]